ncbi:MAG: alpha-hydroxy acid oxidase, partial [Saprospiraceae bacterium]
MALDFNTQYPSIEDLRAKAKRRIPRFAFEYLDGGCNEDINLHKNTADIREINLQPRYVSSFHEASLKTKCMGIEYDAPFGVAPIGLQGLIWPNSPEILARAAFEHNIPFVLSTVSTSSIERISELTEGKAWFQLYHPTENRLRDDIIRRAADAECPVLIILCDVPTFGFRPRDIRNGLSMPPKMSLSNMMQVLGKPGWALETLKHGTPNFESLKPYMAKDLNIAKLGAFMNQTFSGRLDEEKIKPI